MKRVVIQGQRGSFHDRAAHEYFKDEDIELICCPTFEVLFSEMKKDDTLIALMAIENTIAGSLLHNYELLRASGLTIIGEHKMHVEHSLVCLPDDNMETIKEINSHPVALAQCMQYLEKFPQFKIVETDDTAGAAEGISKNHLKGHAAICHENVASLYGLKVLRRGIEDNKHNFTRFLVLCDSWYADRQRELHHTNKSSIVFTLPHEEGSLAKVLSIFSFYHINLTKIQSLPIIGKEWQYLFYADVTYDDYFRYCQSLDAVKPLTQELKVLGEYQGK